ncbi:Holliday junction branch migration protein RuvA [Sediminispirochaeta bajacaliforniensis]|uniref:Holliday junction branch migration protein RuvA n=1 Tax=Sediminispirochaeta bajacaliforniensis TaxID=148 RepID=UPI000373FC57|nr:Holliday junction branch migration protein RuvA [Sediminispirochaeta bajacaliforniensis]
MIESLTGTITGRQGTVLFLSTGAIEWVLEATSSAAMKFASSKETVQIPVHLIHREDAMLLFAFASKKERNLFRELLKVSGIGPKQAVRILSGMEADRFIAALENEDVDLLSSIPGVGKKSAGKIILALRGKLTPAEEEGEAGDESLPFKELVEALNGMGFDRKLAEKALKAALNELEPERFEHDHEKLERELFRAAIVRLSS